MAMKGFPSCSPVSWILQILGWFRAAAPPSLAHGALVGLMILSDAIRQELQGHEPAKLGVLGLIDHTHPAGTESIEDTIMSNRLANHNEAPTEVDTIIGFGSTLS
jgi:hypothetical protein